MFTLLVLNQQRKANEDKVSVAEAEVEKIPGRRALSHQLMGRPVEP